MSAAFDPFAISGFDEINENSNEAFTADFSAFNDETEKQNEVFEPFSLDFSGFSTSVQENNYSIDTDIYSSLFNNSQTKTNEDTIHENSFLSSSSTRSRTRSALVCDSTLRVALHEEMSCVYDMTSKSTSMNIEGTINVELNDEVDGQTFFLSLQDPNNHVGNLTSFFDIVTELKVSEGKDENSFVQKQQIRGHRVFRVDIPGDINSRSDKILRYTGSEFLRPIPLVRFSPLRAVQVLTIPLYQYTLIYFSLDLQLVNSKVQVASKYCRVSIKIRSNPSNEQSIKHLIVLVAVPPNIDGETIKMSTSGVIWDPMKRLVIYTAPELSSGETMEVQLQFELVSSDGIPKFPILVRCDGEKDQLSNIAIQIQGNAEDKISDSNNFILSKAYRLVHRKF